MENSLSLSDPQLFLNLLQWHALRLWNHGLHPNELQNHHAGKEQENITGREHSDHLREEGCEQGGEDPVREAAKRLTFRAMTIRKYFGNENPDDRSLADRVGSNKSEDANWNDGKMTCKESPRDQAERGDVAERTNIKKRATAQPVNQPEPDKRENEIGDSDADGL